MAKRSTSSKDAMEVLREQLKPSEEASWKNDSIRVAWEAARTNPLWADDLETLEKMVLGHKVGDSVSGWKNPYEPTDPRSLLLEYQFVPFHDPSRFVLQLQGRQSGKDFVMEGVAVEDCNKRKTEWMIAAPGERQSLDSLDQAKLWAAAFDLQIADYDEQRMGRDSTTLLKSAELLYSNGSRHRAVPGRPDTVRGRSANVGLTEADFFEDPLGTWRAVLPSITNPLRGGLKKARIVTTPNGKGGLAWKIIDKPQGKKMNWSIHKITILHAVLMGLPVDVEEIREAMDDPEGFAQEYLVEFLDGSNVLLPYDVIQLAESFEATETWDYTQAGSAPVFMGIDFGRTNDPTVCWTLQLEGGILWTREVLVLKDMPTDQQEAILAPRLKRAARTSLDYTGPGIGLGDYLVRHVGEYKPGNHSFGRLELCTFTSKLKRELFPKLRRAFDAPTKLRIPSSTTIREDLHEMRQIIRNQEYTYWSPRTKDGHSDRCTALALAVRAAGDQQAFTFKPRPSGKRSRYSERSLGGV